MGSKRTYKRLGAMLMACVLFLSGIAIMPTVAADTDGLGQSGIVEAEGPTSQEETGVEDSLPSQTGVAGTLFFGERDLSDRIDVTKITVDANGKNIYTYGKETGVNEIHSEVEFSAITYLTFNIDWEVSGREEMIAIASEGDHFTLPLLDFSRSGALMSRASGMEVNTKRGSRNSFTADAFPENDVLLLEVMFTEAAEGYVEIQGQVSFNISFFIEIEDEGYFDLGFYNGADDTPTEGTFFAKTDFNGGANMQYPVADIFIVKVDSSQYGGTSGRINKDEYNTIGGLADVIFELADKDGIPYIFKEQGIGWYSIVEQNDGAPDKTQRLQTDSQGKIKITVSSQYWNNGFILREVKALDGYYPSSNSISIETNFKATQAQRNVYYAVTNDPITAVLKKKASDTDECLPGAVFQLYRQVHGQDLLVTVSDIGGGMYLYDEYDQSETVSEMTTDSAGVIRVIYLPAGEYYWMETMAPDGFINSEARYPFAVGNGGALTQVTVHNDRIEEPEEPDPEEPDDKEKPKDPDPDDEEKPEEPDTDDKEEPKEPNPGDKEEPKEPNLGDKEEPKEPDPDDKEKPKDPDPEKPGTTNPPSDNKDRDKDPGTDTPDDHGGGNTPGGGGREGGRRSFGGTTTIYQEDIPLATTLLKIIDEDIPLSIIDIPDTGAAGSCKALAAALLMLAAVVVGRRALTVEQ